MRLVSLTLENWRGVDRREIAFDASVTLIEGPNEVGKSSLVEALRMLFRDKASSKRSEVKAVQPVDRDVGSSVTAELHCGEYHFSYHKTYNRKAATELRIHAPRPEQLTGDDAHNRAWEILSGHIDMALWDALLVEQGKEIGGVKLSDSDGLARALDNAAGGVGFSGEESALFDAVQAEYERYYTLKTGKPKFGDQQQRVAQCTARVGDLEARLRALDESLRRYDSVTAELARLQRAVPEMQASQAELQQRWQAIDGLRAQLAARENDTRPQQQLLAAAREKSQRRASAAADIAQREQSLNQQRAVLQPLADTAEDLARQVQVAEEALTQRQEQRRALHAAVQQARADADHLSDAETLARLRQQLTRVREQRTELAGLRRTLADIRIDSAGRKAIQAAASDLDVARRTRESAATRLTIDALHAVDFQLNGQRVGLVPDTPLSRSVTETLRIDIPELASITISPAASAGELAADVAALQEKLDALLVRYQVSSVEQAIALDERRVSAEQDLRAVRQRIEDSLQGADEDALQAEVERLAQAGEAFLQQRPPERPLPASAREARQNLTAASSALDACESELNADASRLDALRAEHTRTLAARQQADTEINALTSVLDEKQTSLAGERDAEPDAVLQQAVTEREQQLAAITAELDQLRAQLRAEDPESAKLRLDTVTQALQRAQRDIIEQEKQQAVLKNELDRAQANGLYEELEQARLSLVEAEDELAATTRRAAAAALLWETLNEHRNASRQAYVRPLQAGIQGLGRIVFGSDFEVELGEDWALLNVTRNGQTVPFDSLSVGAKEQLGILTRLAAARIVADQGGVPVIIDDALGFSDPTRLQSMASAITAAGRDAQIVVLTCTPGRFMHLGDVGVVRL